MIDFQSRERIGPGEMTPYIRLEIKYGKVHGGAHATIALITLSGAPKDKEPAHDRSSN